MTSYMISVEIAMNVTIASESFTKSSQWLFFLIIKQNEIFQVNKMQYQYFYC